MINQAMIDRIVRASVVVSSCCSSSFTKTSTSLDFEKETYSLFLRFCCPDTGMIIRPRPLRKNVPNLPPLLGRLHWLFMITLAYVEQFYARAAH
jgi:hypothetical protein